MENRLTTGKVVLVPVSVDLDLVSSCQDLADEIGIGLDQGADAEEGGGQAELIQSIEDPRGGLRIGAVIKGQGDGSPGRAAPSAQVGGKGPNRDPLAQAHDARDHVYGNGGANRGPRLVHPWLAWASSLSASSLSAFMSHQSR